MSSIQDKFESGVSKIQDGIDLNKSKLDDKKTISKYNKVIEDAQFNRDSLLLEIGTLVYEKIRRNELSDLEISEKCKPLVGFDYTIYKNKMNIREITKTNEGIVCECNTVLSQDDKFCSGCGKKVEVIKDSIEYIRCSTCEMDIPSDSTFCPCCGYKVNNIL